MTKDPHPTITPTRLPTAFSNSAEFHLKRCLIPFDAAPMFDLLEGLLWVVDRNQPLNNLRWVIP